MATAPLARSNSFFGAIKSIVAAPFTWFAGSEDDFEDTRGKRRRLPVISEESRWDDAESQSRAKRMRVGSPDRDTQPYLDPPRSAFAQPRRTSDPSSQNATRDLSRSPRKTLHIPRSSSISHQLTRNRRTVSPLPSGSHLKAQGMTRTMSLDPPSFSSFSSRVQVVPAIQDLQPESNHDMREEMPVSRDVSMSPRRLRVRSSLTPQPSGPSFGPVVPPPRERGPDEPPTLTALMSNPTFVRPPPGSQKKNGAEPQKPLTLGSLVDQRRTRTPARQSSILFGTGSMTDVSARHLWPVNKAEVALHELEVYKTPLLPTRLKGATAIPDMFMYKEKKPITLMNDDRPSKPRLGTKSKGKEKGKGKKKDKEAANSTKPYAGEGGMKKWLARRKKEEEEAKEMEEANAMEDEKVEEEQKRKEAEAEKQKREAELRMPPPPAAPVFEPRVAREGPLTSSLRVGRARTGRNHIDRPVSRRAKFSAAFEDEDEEMDDARAAEHKALEEAAKKAPVFEISAGFTFAKETTIAHDLTKAKEPPVTSLPFSLTTSAPPPVSAPVATEPAKTAPEPAPVPVLPTISLVPPTPETTKIASEPPPAPPVPVASSAATLAPPVTTPSGIPNFFASSSIFAKPATLPTPPSFSLTTPSEERPKPATLEVPAPKAPEAPSLFGAASRPISAFGPLAASAPAAPTSIFGAPLSPPKESEKPATPAPILASAFTFGAPAKPAESTPAPAPVPSPSPAPPQAAEPSKTTAPSGSPFAFGISSPTPAPVAPIATAEAPKSVFAFGQPSPAAVTAPPAAAAPVPADAPLTTEPTKSLFGTQPSTTPFTFDQRPSTAPAEGKPAQSAPFSFATPSAAEKKPATGFTFGAPSTPAPAAPAATTAFLFGTPSGTAVADVSSKPFASGVTTPTRPATPPKVEQEVTMDESPARDMVINGNGKAPERPTLNFAFNTPSTSGSALFAQSPATTAPPFSFGSASATVNPFAKEEKKEIKPAVSFGGFGQTTSTGFGFGQKPPESPVTTTTAPFQFTQPSPSVAPVSPFTFGAVAPAASPFGQASTGSAPSSPSTFNRPSPFSFGTPTTTQPAANPFAFGAASQPASPATSNTALPTGTTGGSFSFGTGTTGTTAPAAPTPFGAPAPGASTLFTIGSAPPADAGGARRIKGLPRRGARR